MNVLPDLDPVANSFVAWIWKPLFIHRDFHCSAFATMAIKQTTQDDWSHWLKHGCLPLFDIDRPVEYRHWKSDDCSFQLRCIGGPGSGKVNAPEPSSKQTRLHVVLRLRLLSPT